MQSNRGRNSPQRMVSTNRYYDGDYEDDDEDENEDGFNQQVDNYDDLW